jgi:Flp pilus assembly protein TadD
VSPWLLLLLAAVRQLPETPAVREQARLCLAEDGDEGLAHCRLALEGGLKPARAAVVSSVLATRLVAADRWDEASAVLDAWCRLSPADPEPQRRLADVLLFGLGRTDEAVARLQEAARLLPDDAATWGELGTALAAARRYEEARQAFDEALRLDTSFFELRPAARAVADAARQQKSWP